jgi:protocatechuate 3,4-dioxygenase alpha subunit
MSAPSSEHTIGPFFPRTFFRAQDNDLTVMEEGAAGAAKGEVIILRGQVRREDAVPCLNMILEAWQADAGGHFDHPLDPGRDQADPHFLGWGRAWTDAEGRYEFRTVMPGGYADPAGPRAPHINLAVMGAGLMRRAQTTVFFPDHEAAHGADPVMALVPPPLRPRLVAVPEGMEGGSRVFRFDIRLRGGPAEETPFFED